MPLQFESKVAKRWRWRRAFIAGDAAHLTPPFMGQGMCAGVRDASNLAWKLALAVSGQIQDTEAVLDTYQAQHECNCTNVKADQRTIHQHASPKDKMIRV